MIPQIEKKNSYGCVRERGREGENERERQRQRERERERERERKCHSTTESTKWTHNFTKLLTSVYIHNINHQILPVMPSHTNP